MEDYKQLMKMNSEELIKFMSYFMLILIKALASLTSGLPLIPSVSFITLLHRDSYRLQYTCQI